MLAVQAVAGPLGPGPPRNGRRRSAPWCPSSRKQLGRADHERDAEKVVRGSAGHYESEALGRAQRARRWRCGPCGPKDGGRSLAAPGVVWWEEEDRTPDLRIANATLSQLSYPTTARILANFAHPSSRMQRMASRTRLARTQQYDNRADSVAEVGEHPGALGEALGRWREQSDCVLDVPYGDAPRDARPVPQRGREAPVFVFIHGGWCARSTSATTFVAPALADAGRWWMPNYALCPAVSIDAIALQLTRDAPGVWRHARAIGGGDRATSSSAATRRAANRPAMLLGAAGAGGGRPAGQSAAAAISDLRPVRARADAPHAFLEARSAPHGRSRAPQPGVDASGAHGLGWRPWSAATSDEFLRQNQLIRSAWGEAPCCRCARRSRHNHFRRAARAGRSARAAAPHRPEWLGLAAGNAG